MREVQVRMSRDCDLKTINSLGVKIKDLEDAVLLEYEKYRILFTKRSIDAKKKSDLADLSDRLGFDLDKIYYNKQVHSSKVRLIRDSFENHEAEFYSDDTRIFEADSLVTGIGDISLLVFTADCVPIVLLDTKKEIIANIHAGWRGTYSNIVANTLECMKNNFDTKVSDVVAIIGPSIRSCCYEVGDDLVEKFRELVKNTSFAYDFDECFRVHEGRSFINLQKINEVLLKDFGVEQEKILDMGICTSCENEKFFSYRLDDKTLSRIGTLVYKIKQIQI